MAAYGAERSQESREWRDLPRGNLLCVFCDCSGGLLPKCRKILHRSLLQFVFLQLAAGGLRKLCYELDILRDFERRNLSLAEGRDFLGRGRFALLQPDRSGNVFSEFPVRHSVNRDVADLGMAAQKFFNLPRIDVLTAADDHLLLAA